MPQINLKRLCKFKITGRCGTCGRKLGTKRRECRDPFDCLGGAT